MKRRRSDNEDQPDQPEARQSSPSSAASSPANEGNVADTEGDGNPTTQAEAEANEGPSRTGEGEPSSSTAPPPAKKKRTRTLTTPHQSAVLHALLAQSRFPTTAMREEVGRAIGLSARKVQVWFQNQRQKARRPGTRTHEGQGARSDLVRHSSGPYGVHVPGAATPFQPNPSSSGQSVAGPSSYPGAMYSSSAPGPSSSAGPPYDLHAPGGRLSSAQLSGPGVPGTTVTYQTSPSILEPYERFPPTSRYTVPISDYPLHPPPLRYSSPEPWVPLEERSTPLLEPSIHALHRDPSRNLLPFALDEPRLPPLELVPPPRHWSQIDSPHHSPISYRPSSIMSPPRQRSPITLPAPIAHPVLPRLRIPSPPARFPMDRTLAPLVFPPPSAGPQAQASPSTSTLRGEREYSPLSARGLRAPLSLIREVHAPPFAHTTLEPYQEQPQSSPLSARPVYTSSQDSHTHTTEAALPRELQSQSSPVGAYHSSEPSPIVGRTRRFDPVRAAISDNESREHTPPAEPRT